MQGRTDVKQKKKHWLETVFSCRLFFHLRTHLSMAWKKSVDICHLK